MIRELPISATADPNRAAIPIPSTRFWRSMHMWQREAFHTLDNEAPRFLFYLWHRGARKTTLVLNMLIRECAMFGKRTNVYIGPTDIQARRVIWDEPTMLFDWLPAQSEFRWKSNDTRMTITFANKSVLAITGADKPDKLRGMNPYGVAIDEFGEHKADLWPAILQPILRRSKDRWCVIAMTPKGANHAKTLWDVTQSDPEWHHQTLRCSQSGIIPPDELEAARRTTPRWLYEQEYECSWITDEEMVLITSALIDSLRGLKVAQLGVRRVVAYDPNASLTGDRSAMYYMENHEIKDEQIFYERDTTRGAHLANLMCKKHSCPNIVVDWTGIGVGVCDQLRRLGLNVIEFISSGKPSIETLENQRTEAYWVTMEKMMASETPYPEGFESAPTLREELASVRIKQGRRLGLEHKQEVKARLGRSPDCADAYTMGIWASRIVPVETADAPIETWRQPERTDIAESYTIKTVIGKSRHRR